MVMRKVRKPPDEDSVTPVQSYFAMIKDSLLIILIACFSSRRGQTKKIKISENIGIWNMIQ